MFLYIAVYKYRLNSILTMASKPKKLQEYSRNFESPFMKESYPEINSNIVKKYRSSTNTEEKAILKAVDDNGEVLGHTSFVRQIEVDEDKFAKVYLSQFSAFFELKQPAIKVFGYILHQLVPRSDIINFFIQDCLTYSGYKTKKSIYDGLAGLVENNIIARGPSESVYFLNPMVAFNGDRITFAKSYVKKKKQKEVNNPNQTNLLDAIDNAEKE